MYLCHAEVGNLYCRNYLYHYLLNVTTELPLLNKNSSELPLPMYATAPFGALLKIFLVLFY